MKLNIKGKDIEVNEDKLIELIKREGLEVRSGEFEEGQEYQILTSYQDISPCVWKNNGDDKARREIGMAFHTKELAKQALERRKSIVRLWNWQKENAPFEPDWSDEDQDKYYSVYTHYKKELSYRRDDYIQYQTELPYFDTSDDVERFNKACELDLLKVFNVK